MCTRATGSLGLQLSYAMYLEVNFATRVVAEVYVPKRVRVDDDEVNYRRGFAQHLNGQNVTSLLPSLISVRLGLHGYVHSTCLLWFKRTWCT